MHTLLCVYMDIYLLFFTMYAHINIMVYRSEFSVSTEKIRCHSTCTVMVLYIDATVHDCMSKDSGCTIAELLSNKSSAIHDSDGSCQPHASQE